MLTEVASAVSVPEATTPPSTSSSTVAPASFATLTVTVGVALFVVIVEPPSMLTPLGATTIELIQSSFYKQTITRQNGWNAFHQPITISPQNVLPPE
jgi:hypothetical protein